MSRSQDSNQSTKEIAIPTSAQAVPEKDTSSIAQKSTSISYRNRHIESYIEAYASARTEKKRAESAAEKDGKKEEYKTEYDYDDMFPFGEMDGFDSPQSGVGK